jgi:cell wall-associated NlpC family hydrolase
MGLKSLQGVAGMLMLAAVGCAGGRPAHDFSALADHSAAPPSQIYAKVVQTAQALLGTPYRYGGTTPQGFDCSGFLYYVYRNAAGVTLPRVTHEQITRGKAVSIAELRPADLVYFRIGRKKLHAGIYLGGGHFIHAPSSGGHVNVQRLTLDYWATRYLGARRLL